MSELDPLIVDLLEWIGPHTRPYAEVLDAWKTSCPQLPVWEEANDRALVRCHRGEVSLSPSGVDYLRERRG